MIKECQRCGNDNEIISTHSMWIGLISPVHLHIPSDAAIQAIHAYSHVVFVFYS